MVIRDDLALRLREQVQAEKVGRYRLIDGLEVAAAIVAAIDAGEAVVGPYPPVCIGVLRPYVSRRILTRMDPAIDAPPEFARLKMPPCPGACARMLRDVFGEDLPAKGFPRREGRLAV
jgi:hypothetical protein